MRTKSKSTWCLYKQKLQKCYEKDFKDDSEFKNKTEKWQKTQKNSKLVFLKKIDGNTDFINT